MAIMLLLGFSSGLPLSLSAGTLQAWLTSTGIDIVTIGVFSIVGMPYTLKFLWSPLMDRFVPPRLGRRRGWMLLTQVLLAGLLAGMAFQDPHTGIAVIAALALAIAFCSASQDVALDAYRADLLPPRERGPGVALSVLGYRGGMLVAGSVALVVADALGWQATYCLMAVLMGVGMAAALLGPEPAVRTAAPASLQAAVIEPFLEFLTRRRALALLLLLVLYKLGDAFAGTLTTAFLLRGLEFSLTDVGVVNKGVGLAATMVGVVAGGALLVRLTLFKCLLAFGVLQAVTNLGFMALALAGKSYAGMVAVIVLENLSGGMGTAAFVAFLIALCDQRYTATQFALLSALASVARVFIGPPAGLVVDAAGWPLFFLVTTLAAIPGLLLLAWLKAEVDRRDQRPAQAPIAAED